MERERVGIKCLLFPGWVPWDRVRQDPLGYLLGTSCVPGFQEEAGHRNQYDLTPPMRVAERPFYWGQTAAFIESLLSKLHVMKHHTKDPTCAGSPCGFTTAHFTEEKTEAQTK